MPRYVNIGFVNLKPGSRALAEGVADQGAGAFAQVPGFQSVTFFLDEERSVYGAVSFWDSKASAEASEGMLNPGFTAAFGDSLLGEINVQVYEVYEPKGS